MTMTTPQLTFWVTNVTLSVFLFIAFYPGVRRHAQTIRDSAIAAGMAATLCSTAAALFTSFFVNAVYVIYLRQM